MRKTYVLLVTVICLCLLVAIFNTTTPVTAGPFGILVSFLLAYVVIVVAIAYLLYWASRLLTRLSSTLVSRRPFQPMSLARSYYYASVLAAAPIMLVGLQSVGSVGFYELLLVSVFVVIGCLYISKRIS